MSQMKITEKLIEAKLRCNHMANKISISEDIPELEIQRVRGTILTYHADHCRRVLQEMYQVCQCNSPTGFATLPNINEPMVAFGFSVGNSEVDLTVDAVVIKRDRHQKISIEPIFFILNRKADSTQRRLALIKSQLIEETTGIRVSKCAIFLLQSHRPSRINVVARSADQRLIGSIKEQLKGGVQRTLATSIAYCKQCPFEKSCLEELKARDDLSLLGGISKNEIKANQSRGIFTVNQLSHSYRPRRRPEGSKPKFYASLKAMAIREAKVFISQRPIAIADDIDVFVDVEGLPDSDFYYLIGVHVRTTRGIKTYSFWAEKADDERQIWFEFLKLIKSIKQYRIYHYGSYEKVFFDKMRKRYRLTGDEAQVFEIMRGKLVNVVSLIYGQIYFPTYTNGLKDIGGYLGTKWSANANGLLSVAWRDAWEVSKSSEFKALIEKYNFEDCAALVTLVDFIRKISISKNKPLIDGKQVESADDVRLSSKYRWGKTSFLIPELEEINKCAYFDYQSTKIFFGNDRKKKKIRLNNKSKQRIKMRINKTIILEPSKKCPQCKNTSTYRHGHYTRMQIDIKFFDGGIKRWIVRSEVNRRRCRLCRCTYMPSDYPRYSPRFGWNFKAYVIYLSVALRLNFGEISEFLVRTLRLPMSRTSLWKMKQELAEYYQPTIKKIFSEMKRGPLLQVDETNAKTTNRGCYVWVFATLSEVVYIFAENRKGDILQRNLKNFRGVLFSDFFAAYDSVPCKQQKCLVHLIRDLNDDLFKNQLNDEFKEFVAEFAMLMKKIIDTIDLHGLRSRYLSKHKKDVSLFFKKIERAKFSTEISLQYQRRFLKNQNRLFVFLNYDNVPWNNNYAENAIKTFAELRHKFSRKKFLQEGLKEYLVLLSIQHTCKLRGIDFLQFLLSRRKQLPPMKLTRREQ